MSEPTWSPFDDEGTYFRESGADMACAGRPLSSVERGSGEGAAGPVLVTPIRHETSAGANDRAGAGPVADLIERQRAKTMQRFVDIPHDVDGSWLAKPGSPDGERYRCHPLDLYAHPCGDSCEGQCRD